MGARPDDRMPWGYFAFTFGFRWLVWLPGILGKYKTIPVSAGGARAIAIAGIFGPVFGACVMACRSGGSIGVKQHLARLFDFRIRVTGPSTFRFSEQIPRTYRWKQIIIAPSH